MLEGDANEGFFALHRKNTKFVVTPPSTHIRTELRRLQNSVALGCANQVVRKERKRQTEKETKGQREKERKEKEVQYGMSLRRFHVIKGLRESQNSGLERTTISKYTP